MSKQTQPVAELGPNDNHWTVRFYKERCNRRRMQYLLMHHDTAIIRGCLCHLKHKHCGCGIYEFWFEAESGAQP